MIAWAFAVGQNGHLPPMEIGIKNQIFYLNKTGDSVVVVCVVT